MSCHTHPFSPPLSAFGVRTFPRDGPMSDSLNSKTAEVDEAIRSLEDRVLAAESGRGFSAGRTGRTRHPARPNQHLLPALRRGNACRAHLHSPLGARLARRTLPWRLGSHS